MASCSYEPSDSTESIDFTWEREWRIKCEYLVFDQRSANIVVLDQSWADRLVSEHDREEDYRITQYKLISMTTYSSKRTVTLSVDSIDTALNAPNHRLDPDRQPARYARWPRLVSLRVRSPA